MTRCRALQEQAVSTKDPEIREIIHIEFIQKFEKLAHFIIRRKIRNISQAEREDLFHNIVLQWLSDLPNWTDETKLCVWCAQHANRCADKARRERDKRNKEGPIENDIVDNSRRTDPDTALCFEQTIEQFRSDKQVVIRQRRKNYSIQEIADQVKRTRQIVSSWLNEMFKELVKCLKNE